MNKTDLIAKVVAATSFSAEELTSKTTKELKALLSMPKAEEPKAEEPKAEEPKAEEPKAEEPKAPKVDKEADALRSAIACEFKAGIKKMAAALALLEAAGYSLENSKEENATILKACKKAVLLSYRRNKDFAVGDGTEGDRGYKAACSALQKQSAAGRHDDDTGQANRAPRTPAGGAPAGGAPAGGAPKGQPTTIQAVKLNRVELEDLEREVTFKGTIPEFIDVFQEELFPALASKAETLKAFFEYLKTAYAANK